MKNMFTLLMVKPSPATMGQGRKNITRLTERKASGLNPIPASNAGQQYVANGSAANGFVARRLSAQLSTKQPGGDFQFNFNFHIQ